MPLTIKAFKYSIHSFHFFGAAGFLVGLLLGILIAYVTGLPIWPVLLCALSGAGILISLAWLYKVITGREDLVYYQHEISIMIFCLILLALLKQPVLKYLDITLMGIGVFLAFGRIGCFSVGCCHGRPYKHGIKYGQNHVDDGFTWYYKGVALFPVQLIESGYVFVVVIISAILLLNHAQPGTVLIVYTVIYGLMRFILEYFRGDPERPLWLGISEAQWTTLALITITFTLSQLGWLPVYKWHLAILILLIVASVITIYRFKSNPNHEIFTPSHIQQMAEGLALLEHENANDKQANNQVVKLFTTRCGISLSYDKFHEILNAGHYTISSKSDCKLSYGIAERIARVINVLKHLNGNYELIEKQNGIYHIIFNLKIESNN